MGIGRRSAPYETFYLYHLHRSDPPRHAIGCPHRIPESAPERVNLLPAVEIERGFINVHLAAPLFTIETRGLPGEPRQNTATHRDIRVGRSADMSELLQLLWSEAELNVWNNRFLGRRTYYVVRERLLKTAARVLIRGRPLWHRLYIPPPYRPERCDDISKELTAFAARLARGNGRRWFGFIGGLLKELKETEEGAAALSFAHTHVKAWVRGDRWRQLKKGLFADPLPGMGGVHFVLARALLHEAPRVWWSVEDLAAIQIADTKCWIPVGSGQERVLALRLVENGRRFRKPMQLKSSAGELLPAFILEDRADRAYIDVFDPKKKALYGALDPTVWLWDSNVQREPFGLPPPDDSAGR